MQFCEHSENIDAVAELYATAYEGTGMTAQEIWEECICDSLGDMNIFARDEIKGAVLDEVIPAIKAVTSETKSPTQTRGSPDGKASREKYWYPDLTQKEWDLLNYRLDRELENSDNFIDKVTKWLYADSRGTKVFAIYGIGDGTEATVLYAVGGKEAQQLNDRRIEYESNINRTERNPYKKSLNRLGVQQHQYGNGSNRDRQNVSRTDIGVRSVPSGEQRGHNGGAVLSDSTQGKFSRELDTERVSYAPTFYSHMGKVIDDIKLEKMGAGGVVSYLKGRGVKDEEIKWSGIEAFLEGKKSVTKAELQEFVAGSQLQVEEYGNKSTDATLQKIDHGIYEISLNDRYDSKIRLYENGRGVWLDDHTGADWESPEKALKYYQSQSDRISRETKWSDYKLDGGSNYRELVFKMPYSTYSNSAMRTHWGDDAKGILAHARMQDFVVDGKKMLFIEEIQSDWHNEGHSKGYSNPEYEAAVKTYDDLYNKYQQLDLDFSKYVRSNDFMRDPEDVRKKKFDSLREKVDGAQKKYIEANKVVKALKEKGMGDVPDAPFNNNYHEYVLKRLLRMAAEEGYDSIGWTPADIQSERWSDVYAEGYRIEYDQDIPKFLRKYGKKWGATVGRKALPSLKSNASFYDVNRQEEYESFVEWQNIVERDLKAQGASMRNLKCEIDDNYWIVYDKISGVEYDRAEICRTSESVWSMDITDSMKDSVLYEGQPRFSRELDFIDHINEQAEEEGARKALSQTSGALDGKASGETYTEAQYNKFGWVRANDVISEGYWNNFTRNYADAVYNKNFDRITPDGEYMIEIYDQKLEERLQVIDHIVFAKGPIENPNVTKILQIYEYEETKLNKYRRNVYDFGRRGIQPEIGELFELHSKADFGTYDQESNRREVSRYSKQFGTERGGSSKAASRVKEYIFEVEDSEVSGKASRELAFIDFINEQAGEESDPDLTKTQKVAKVRGELEKMNVGKGEIMAVMKLADKMFDLYGGDSSISDFRYGLFEATKLALNGSETGFEAAYDIIHTLSREVAYNPKDLGGEAEQLAEIKREIRGTKMFVGAADKTSGEFERYGGYGAFRKRHLGKFMLANDGVAVDVKYGELQNLFGVSFFPDVNNLGITKKRAKMAKTRAS